MRPEQPVGVLEGFYSFSGHFQTKLGGDVDNGVDDRSVGLALDAVVQESAVDLNLVRGERFEVAERRVSGAEIVNDDSYSEAAQFLQHAGYADGVAQKEVLRDLQLELDREKTLQLIADIGVVLRAIRCAATLVQHVRDERYAAPEDLELQDQVVVADGFDAVHMVGQVVLEKLELASHCVISQLVFRNDSSNTLVRCTWS